MSVMDLIKKYRQSSQTTMGGEAASSLDASGGVIRRDTGADVAGAQLAKNVLGAAGEEAASATLETDQREMAQMQRTQQVTEQRQRGISDKQKYELKASELIDHLTRERKELSTREQLDRMEVAASQLRLADDKYRSQLEDVGRRQRLTDSIAFNEEMKRAIFADEAEVFRYNVKMKRALDLDDAEFDRWLADMNIETALQVADVDKAAAATSATISGVGQTVVAGVSAYEKYKPEPEPKPKPKPT